MNTITVRIVTQYGNERIFPACANAELFASIAGTKTLSRANIEHIKALGFAVEVAPEITSL